MLVRSTLNARSMGVAVGVAAESRQVVHTSAAQHTPSSSAECGHRRWAVRDTPSTAARSVHDIPSTGAASRTGATPRQRFFEVTPT